MTKLWGIANPQTQIELIVHNEYTIIIIGRIIYNYGIIIKIIKEKYKNVLTI